MKLSDKFKLYNYIYEDMFHISTDIEFIIRDMVSNQDSIYGGAGLEWVFDQLDFLRTLSFSCDHIVELGSFDINSSWAFLAAKPKKILLVDWVKTKKMIDKETFPCHGQDRFVDFNRFPGGWDHFNLVATFNNIQVEFVKGDSRTVDIPNTDLLFIDTWHSYNQLEKELNKHHNKVNKYIAIQDTNPFGYVSKPDFSDVRSGRAKESDRIPDGGLNRAIFEFLEENKDWKETYRIKQNAGLVVLSKRIRKPFSVPNI